MTAILSLTLLDYQGTRILGLNRASTNNVSFGLTVSCLVRLRLLQQELLRTTPQA